MDGNSQQLRLRLSDVLCADVVGYSAHMQHDERATHLAYRACVSNFIEPLISKNFGSIVKSTGDGFIVQFDSIIAAMDCAITIQKNIADYLEENAIKPALQFRLGVNAGDVISEEEDIYGNDVNLAARLQQHALPGAICITAGTYEQIKGKVDAQFEDLGDIIFKNEDTPTRVFKCLPEGAGLPAENARKNTFGRQSKIFDQKKPFQFGIAAAVVFVAAITGFLGIRHGDIPPPAINTPSDSPPRTADERSRPSIAVLALEDRSQSPETHALALGIGDTIATALAASQRFFVIDPKSSLEFSSASPSLKEIARQLNVRFLLLGSVIQKGQKIRVNARLVDMQSGRNHWA